MPGESESTREGKRRNETGWSKNRELVEPVRREENKPTKPVKPEEGWEREKKPVECHYLRYFDWIDLKPRLALL